MVAERTNYPVLIHSLQVVEDKVVTALVPEGTVPGPATSESSGKSTTAAAGGGKGTSSSTAAAAPPPAKRARTEPEVTTGGKGISLTIVCVAGGGLEEQELEVEVDEKMTVRALKQSLAEADLGPGITADKLILKDEATGSKLSVSSCWTKLIPACLFFLSVRCMYTP